MIALVSFKYRSTVDELLMTRSIWSFTSRVCPSELGQDGGSCQAGLSRDHDPPCPLLVLLSRQFA